MRKTKLLFRNRSMEVGGIEGVLIALLEHLDKSKYEITLLLNYLQGDYVSKIPKGIRVVSVAEGKENFSRNKLINFVQKASRRMRLYKFQKNPKGFFNENKLMDYDYDIAFSNSTMTDVLNSPDTKSKKIFWFHGNLPDFHNTDAEKAELVKQMQSFDKGVLVSHYAKNAIEKTWNVDLSNTIVIHNPIDTELILQKAQEPTDEQLPFFAFISVGRLSPSKGYVDLVKVHTRLIADGFTIKTAVVGDGSDEATIRQIIAENNLEDSFFLLGYKDNPLKYIANSKTFVLPTYTESYPLVIAEALVLGLPVVTTKVGGIPEMMTDNVNGLILKTGEEALYQGLKELLLNPQKAETFRENNKNMAEKFDLKAKISEVENLFNS